MTLDRANLRIQRRDLPGDQSPNQMLQRSIAGGVVRVGVSKEIIPVLCEMGLDPDVVFHGAGLDTWLFKNEDNFIPYATLRRLLMACVMHTNCPHFGLIVGQRGTISSLGPVGGLLQHAPTVREALSDLVQHIHLHDRGAAPTLSIDGDVVTLGYAIYEPDVESPGQICDGIMAVMTNVMRRLCGSDWRPDEVLLPRQSPVDSAPYRKFFQANILFDQEIAALVFSARWLGRCIADADPVFRKVFEDRIRELEAAAKGDWKESLRRVLRTEILANRCSAATVADRFAVHRRTLSRYLQAEGAGFQRLVDETRFEIARQLLSQTRMPLSQVAAALGYSEASAFTRAFRRWSGQPPAAWRMQHAPAQSGTPVPRSRDRKRRRITEGTVRTLSPSSMDLLGPQLKLYESGIRPLRVSQCQANGLDGQADKTDGIVRARNH